MDKFYPLIIFFSTAFTAKAQIPIAASPATGNTSNCPPLPIFTVSNLEKLNPGLYILQTINDGASAVIKFTVAR